MRVEAVIAQALDNASLDYLEYKGEELDEKEVKRRQRAVSLISHVARNGLIVFDNHSLRVYLISRRQRCLFEVPTIANDAKRNKAPIAVTIMFDSQLSKEDEKDIVKEMEEIAHRTGRILDDNCKVQLGKALTTLAMKINDGFKADNDKPRSRVPVAIALIGGISVAGIVGRKLFKKRIEKSNYHGYQKKIHRLKEKMQKLFEIVTL